MLLKIKKLQPYKIFITQLLEEFDTYNIQNVPCTNNRYADAMASADSLIPNDIEDEETLLTIQNLGIPSYLDAIETHILHLILDKDPYHQHVNIYKYLKDQTIPTNSDRNDKIKLKITAIKYVIIGEFLYRRSFDGTLLRYLTQDKNITILEQAHDNLCGGHFHAKVLHTKLLRIGYY